MVAGGAAKKGDERDVDVDDDDYETTPRSGSEQARGDAPKSDAVDIDDDESDESARPGRA